MRLANPTTRREAITSRPLLLAGIARQTTHAGQLRLLVTLPHACTDQIKSMIANVRQGLETVLASAPQLTETNRWPALVRYIISKIVVVKQELSASYPPHPPPSAALPAG